MSLQQDLDQLRQEFSAKMPKETLEIAGKADAELAEQQVLRKALKTGDTAPDFSLPDPNGRSVSLYENLKVGPVILVFYRGGWCPYCSLTLRAYQRLLPAIRDAGALLIAVSPQSPDNSLSTQEKNALTFPVLSDLRSEAAKSFGILYRLPDDLQKLYTKVGNGLDVINADGQWTLPIPATYVIAPDGHIVAHHVEIDYRTRMEPQDALATAIRISQKPEPRALSA
jgi:peroxiredoxin